MDIGFYFLGVQMLTGLGTRGFGIHVRTLEEEANDVRHSVGVIERGVHLVLDVLVSLLFTLGLGCFLYRFLCV